MNESNDYNALNGADYELGISGDRTLHLPIKNNNGATNWRQLRQQSDHALINCVLEDTTHTSYFTKPPLRTFTLFFEDPKVERDYRKTAWRGPRATVRNESGPETNPVKTWSPAIFNAYFDVLVVALVFGIICLDCFLSYPFTSLWMAYFATASLFLATVIFVMIKQSNSIHLKASTSNTKPQAQTGMYVTKPKKPMLGRVRRSTIFVLMRLIQDVFCRFIVGVEAGFRPIVWALCSWLCQFWLSWPTSFVMSPITMKMMVKETSSFSLSLSA